MIKKFSPEDEIRPKLRDYPKQNIGCGKHYCDNKIWFNCGDRWGNLYQSCQNQSPLARGSNPQTSGIRPKDTPVDTTNRNEAGTQSPSDRGDGLKSDNIHSPLDDKGTSTLSSWIRTSQHPLAPYVTVTAIQEFIRRLKDKRQSATDFNGKWYQFVDLKEIDKLAGSKLLEGNST